MSRAKKKLPGLEILELLPQEVFSLAPALAPVV